MAATQPETGILRPDIELIRGETPLLFDPASDAYFKVEPGVLDVLAFMTESMPVAQFQDKLARNGIHVSPEQLLRILMFLRQNNLLVPEYGRIGIQRGHEAEIKKKTAFLRFSAAYLFFKLPPWRPELFFEKIAPAVSWLASKWIVFLLLIPAVTGYLLMARDFGSVRTTFLDTLSWAGLAKYFVAILFLKFVHEAAHSLAAIHFHCRVRGIGLGFMVFYPRLYTDTTDSWRLPRKQRLLIDAAGIIIELLLGGCAVLLWTYLPPGAWKSTMFYVFAVSTISTLFVNGNPCIRYDGYYILCDLVNIENLMTRSGEYVKQFWRWHFLKLGAKPQNSRGMFLLTFGVCSFVYRIFLYTSIILVIYHNFVKVLAVGMMILELYSILIYPFWREIKTVRALSKRSANRARWYLGGVVLAVLAVILFLPLSWNITLPGEIVPCDRIQISVSESGYLAARLPRRAFPVKKDDLLVRLNSPALDFSVSRLAGSSEYDRRLYALQQIDEKFFADALITAEKLGANRIGMEELGRRHAELNIRAEIDGVFVPSLPDLSAGAFLGKGQKIGELVSEELMIYAYATDREIGKLKIGDTATVSVKDFLTTVPAKISSVNRIAAQLSDSPLLQHFGGPIPVYPEPGPNKGYSSLQALYRIELQFESISDFAPGRVVAVKIHHTEQLYTRVRQFLVSIFRREF